MSRILLTGATGFLGSGLLKAMVEDGHEVTALKRSTSDPWRIESYKGCFQLENIDQRDVNSILRKQSFEAVIHTSCDYGRQGHSPYQITQTNLMFGFEILQSAIDNDVSYFINTDTLLSRNINAYSLSKKQLVEWLKFFSERIKVVNLKLEHMYGPNDDPNKFVSWLVLQFYKNVPRIPLTEGNQKRDFIYISDVIEAYRTIYKSRDGFQSFKEFDVGSGKLTTIREIAERIRDNYQALNPSSCSELGFGDVSQRINDSYEPVVDISELNALGWNNTVDLDLGINKLLEK